MFSRLRRSLMIIALLVLLAGLAFVWISSSFLLTPNRQALEPRHQSMLAQPAEYGLNLEPFRVRTDDGIGLAAVLVTRAASPGKAEKSRRMASLLGVSFDGPAKTPRGTAFLLHGRSGKKEDMLAVAERFVAADYRCLVYDARCHGESDGENCTFGHAEKGDFRAVLDQTRSLLGNRGEAPGQLCAVGISLGASVLLQSLPDEPRLTAVVAVAPFATLPEVVNHSARRNIYRHIPLWLIAGTMRAGGIRAGFDPFRISPLHGVEQSTHPIFFVHGELDEVIPVEHTRRLHAAAAGPKKLRLIPDGTHGNVLAKGGDDLYREMIEFCLAASVD
jgi:alpha-beta hydrolase superfamily lysophospholipase